MKKHLRSHQNKILPNGLRARKSSQSICLQCPNEKEGVLVAPTVHGNLIVGPDSQPSAANDVSTTKQGLDFERNTALKSVPGINFRESIRNFAGVRAKTADHDFHIYEDKNNKGVCGEVISSGECGHPGLSPHVQLHQIF